MSFDGFAPRSLILVLLLFAALAAVYLSGLGSVGLLGPDEPRYASIGREMARSGDWITPRLWGDAWFEKPPLLYWLIATGYKCGLSGELAPRLPIALLSLVFLVFFWVLVRRLEDEPTAWTTTLMLATGAGWLAYSQVAVTDLPLAATFTSALLLALLWLDTGSRAALLSAGACFGLAILAKGLVPVVLALPFLYFAISSRWKNRWRDLGWGALLAAAVAAPWYVAVLLLHGRAFFDEFFLRHHLSRFSGGEQLHAQPFWFYIPVLLAGLFPWTPALSLIRRECWNSPLRRALAATVGLGFLFFSAAAGKLPGYLMPLIPALCVLLAIAMRTAPSARRSLAWCAVLLGLCPAIAAILPDALLLGLRRAGAGQVSWTHFGAVLPLAAALWILDWKGRRAWACTLLAAGAVAGLLYIKLSAAPVLDQLVSARGLWGRVQVYADTVCVDQLHRNWRYGLNFYSATPLPDCEDTPRPVLLRQPPGRLPVLEPRVNP